MKGVGEPGCVSPRIATVCRRLMKGGNGANSVSVVTLRFPRRLLIIVIIDKQERFLYIN